MKTLLDDFVNNSIDAVTKTTTKEETFKRRNVKHCVCVYFIFYFFFFNALRKRNMSIEHQLQKNNASIGVCRICYEGEYDI